MQKHSELEVKYEASHITETQFQLWCVQRNPVRCDTSYFPDCYYRNETSVIRHRQSGGAGEITVKQRKSENNITDRVEINLQFSDSTSCHDVESFLKATGWKHEVTLRKRFAHTYWFKHGGADLAVSLYEVEGGDGPRISRMMEIEIDNKSAVSDEVAVSILGVWCNVLTDDLSLGFPLDLSLYEIYSGKRYEMADPNRAALEAAFAIRQA